MAPLIDGSAVDPVDLPVVTIDVPYQNPAPLPFIPINQSRYCGLADAVFQQQGEPAVAR